MSSPRSLRLDWSGKRAPAAPPAAELLASEALDRSLTLIEGDNSIALAALGRALPARARLVYLDPPFFTGRQHLQVVRGRDSQGAVTRAERPAFDDRWVDLSEYLEELWPRLVAARELLADSGSLVVHVDPKTSHYVRVLLDEVFGRDCFASEIIWRYRRWPAKTPNFQRVHDVLLRYVRRSDVAPCFNQLYEPLAPSTLATWGDKKQKAVFSEGRRARSSKTETASPGTPLGDVWDIGIIAPVARERTGYPTQKPLALLERLVSALTEPGDLVIDAYAGSGTTLEACAKLGRAAVGIDMNPEALAIARTRLAAHATLQDARLVTRPGLRRGPKQPGALAIAKTG